MIKHNAINERIESSQHLAEEERLKNTEEYQITKEMIEADKSKPPPSYWWERLG